MENKTRNIKMIWDFKGEDSLEIAKHHEIHLKEFSQKESIPFIETGVTTISDMHSFAFITVQESFMKIVRDALIPHRGELAS